MNIEKLDRVVIYVKDLDKAKQTFSRLLDISFEEIPEQVAPREIAPADAISAGRVAISPSGLELIELPAGAIEKEGFVCFHFKVSDYEEAKTEMKERGLPLVVDITLGKLREAVYRPDYLDGAMMGLVSYPTATVMQAIRTRGGA